MLESTKKIKELLESHKIKLDKGITLERLTEIESCFDFKMPPDLSDLLLNFVPRGIKNNDLSFPDWNDEPISSLKKRNEQIFTGILFDIENNNTWYELWGTKPLILNEQKELAMENLSRVVKVYPLIGHRFLPANPFESNNPILSIVQTDIIYYGNNLLNFYQNELNGGGANFNVEYSNIKKLPFWTDFINKIWNK